MFVERDEGTVALANAEALAAAYVEALERILGLTPGSLHLIDPRVLEEWYA
jgi:hypothetical protein